MKRAQTIYALRKYTAYNQLSGMMTWPLEALERLLNYYKENGSSSLVRPHEELFSHRYGYCCCGADSREKIIVGVDYGDITNDEITIVKLTEKEMNRYLQKKEIPPRLNPEQRELMERHKKQYEQRH